MVEHSHVHFPLTLVLCQLPLLGTCCRSCDAGRGDAGGTWHGRDAFLVRDDHGHGYAAKKLRHPQLRKYESRAIRLLRPRRPCWTLSGRSRCCPRGNQRPDTPLPPLPPLLSLEAGGDPESYRGDEPDKCLRAFRYLPTRVSLTDSLRGQSDGCFASGVFERLG